MTVEIIGNNTVEVTIEPTPIVEVLIEPTPTVEVEVYPGGVVNTGSVSLSLEYQLVLGRLTSQPSLYKELTYTDGDLTAIAIWETSAKTTQLISIALSYTDGNLAEKVLTDLVSGKVLTVTYSYTGGVLTSISEVFS